MKSTPTVPGEAHFIADAHDVLTATSSPFRLTTFTRVEYGSKRAEFTIEIQGVGMLSLDFFEPSGRRSFVAPRSIRSKFSGVFERTFRLDDNLAAAILSVVEQHVDSVVASREVPQ